MFCCCQSTKCINAPLGFDVFVLWSINFAKCIDAPLNSINFSCCLQIYKCKQKNGCNLNLHIYSCSIFTSFCCNQQVLLTSFKTKLHHGTSEGCINNVVFVVFIVKGTCLIQWCNFYLFKYNFSCKDIKGEHKLFGNPLNGNVTQGNMNIQNHSLVNWKSFFNWPKKHH